MEDSKSSNYHLRIVTETNISNNQTLLLAEKMFTFSLAPNVGLQWENVYILSDLFCTPIWTKLYHSYGFYL